MGEYATFRGEQVKLGTCENMYYLRADQRHLIEGYDFSEDASGVIRYRFPFPDEDQLEPGQFEDHDRGVTIPGWDLPAGFDGHYSVQFSARPGYLLSVPCPEGDAFPEGLRVGRNGWSGGPVLKQQRFVDGKLVSVVACGSCGAAWRLETIEHAQPVIDAFRAEADAIVARMNASGYDRFLRTIAERIEAGYVIPDRTRTMRGRAEIRAEVEAEATS